MGETINLINAKSITMDVKEVAAYIGVSEDTIYAMAKQKEIPHLRVRYRILFRKDSIDAWMNELEKKSLSKGVVTP
ncbi:MAG: helix-turn-helix domain-containing protein [Vulcanibacillus sp.]